MELKLNYNLKDELLLRNSSIINFSSLEELREIFYKRFKEQEAKRGYYLNSYIRPVSEDYEIIENDEIALVGDEMEFDASMFDEPVEEEKERYEYSNDFINSFLNEDSSSQEKEEPVKEFKREPLRREEFLNLFGEGQVIKPSVSSDDKRVESKGYSEPVVVPEKKEKFYTNLIDFIKDHPNCSIDEASKHFSKKEIQRNIKVGKVYLRRGRLSI